MIIFLTGNKMNNYNVQTSCSNLFNIPVGLLVCVLLVCSANAQVVDVAASSVENADQELTSGQRLIDRWIELALSNHREPPLEDTNTRQAQSQIGQPVSLPFRFQADQYSVQVDQLRELPIGVFDSGIGGLTVLEAILALDQFNNDTMQPDPDGRADFEGEKFIYFGDQANMPYGNYAAVGKQDYLRELVLKDAIFLLGNRYWPQPAAEKPCLDKPPVKAIVIACNTATAYGLEDIKRAIQAWKIPVIVVGVVEAGARGVLESMTVDSQSKSQPQAGSIAVLATVGTCSSGAYPRMIQSALGLAGKPVPHVIQQGFVELAAAIEGDTQVASSGSVDDFIRRDLRRMLDQYRESGGGPPVSRIVLGCTHFPLVQSEILEALSELRASERNGQRPYSELIAPQVTVIDPAAQTAKELWRELARNRLRASGNGPKENRVKEHQVKENRVKDNDAMLGGSAGQVQFFLSVADPTCELAKRTHDGLLEHDYKYSRATGQFSLEDTRVVPMTASALPAPSLTLMQTRLPYVWRAFQAIQ